jgi:hypothetical protein
VPIGQAPPPVPPIGEPVGGIIFVGTALFWPQLVEPVRQAVAVVPEPRAPQQAAGAPLAEMALSPIFLFDPGREH